MGLKMDRAFDPKLSVSAGLDHLATRLDGIIAARLAPQLGKHPWTVILSDLDEMAGRPPKDYSRADLQTQLKMLTRRLGNFGFPFDDNRRTASTLGSELMIVRNARSHGDDFDRLDAWRAHDYCVRLLEHFVDTTGLLKANQLREEAFTAYVEEKGLAPAPIAAMPDDAETVEAETIQPESESTEAKPVRGDSDAAAPVTPDPGVFKREPTAKPKVVDGTRLPFEPWEPVPAGDLSVLDDLPRKAAKQKVRAIASEIVEAEGPIHIERLARLVAASFGLRRLHPQREKKVVNQVKATGLHVDDAKFVWPEDIDPKSWAEFRPNSSDVDRPFEHISPVEIANAMRFLQKRNPEMAAADLDAAALQTFGKKRRTKSVTAHLAKAAALR